MNRESAAELIKRLILTEVEIVKQVNGPRGRASLASLRAERNLIKNIFHAMTGITLTPEELSALVGLWS